MTQAMTAEAVLGGKKILQRSIRGKMDLIELSNTGVTKEALLRLAKYCSFSIHQLSEVLPVTERTIQRYALKKHFNRAVSEHILQLAEVAARGTEVFGDRERFLEWMKAPSAAFADKKPLSLLNSKFGAEMVLDELGRIEHGVFS
jgi:putative toxin-antitoxin system antitoxin component (TIGR02293 family)